MPITPAPPSFSFLLLMLLVVSTGTAWFTALHPRFVWHILQGGVSDETSPVSWRTLRFGGVLFGAAGMLLLLLSDLAS